MIKHIRNMHGIHLDVMSRYQKIVLIPNFEKLYRSTKNALHIRWKQQKTQLGNHQQPAPKASYDDVLFQRDTMKLSY